MPGRYSKAISVGQGSDRSGTEDFALLTYMAHQAIRSAGGEIYGITSEPQTLASEAAESWELDFPLIGDPHHEIADACRERGWLDLYVNTAVASGTFTLSIEAPVHPKGSVLVPARRTRYLAEIAETVRAYHERAETAAAQAREAAGLGRALSALGDPPPASAAPFASPDDAASTPAAPRR